jgi:hypothetical protein
MRLGKISACLAAPARARKIAHTPTMQLAQSATVHPIARDSGPTPRPIIYSRIPGHGQKPNLAPKQHSGSASFEAASKRHTSAHERRAHQVLALALADAGQIRLAHDTAIKYQIRRASGPDLAVHYLQRIPGHGRNPNLPPKQHSGSASFGSPLQSAIPRLTRTHLHFLSI